MVQVVHHHTSVVIIESQVKKEFLFSVYDNTYPKVLYRGRANLIGGNASAKDSSPYGVLVRELKEEFTILQEEAIDDNLIDILGKNPGPQRVKKFASRRDISLIKKGIIKNLSPFQDFLAKIPSLEGSPAFLAIYSVFLSRLPYNIFKCAKENIEKGKGVKCEGYTVIASLDDLKSGKVLTAWGTSPIIGCYAKTTIPNPEGINAIPLGVPRKLFSDYSMEFEYTASIKGQT